MNQSDSKPRIAGSLLWAVAINAPFLLCHPQLTLVENAFVRSLAINAVLFLAPGLPCMFLLRRFGGPDRFGPIPVMGFSFLVFLAAIGWPRLFGGQVSAGGAWTFSWAIADLLLIACAVTKAPVGWDIRMTRKEWAIGIPLFALSYALYFWGAVRVVPAYDDADFELQSTGAGLLHRYEPFSLTDRKTFHYFAHPPLLHFYAAGSFLYFGETDHIDYFEEAAERVRSYEEGGGARPVDFEIELTVNGRPVRHRVSGRDGRNYVVDPPLGGGRSVVPAFDLELALIYHHSRSAPHNLETRAPNLFLAALAAAFLGVWCSRLSGSLAVGLLTALAYGTSPEIFVRASYLYVPINQFTFLVIIIAAMVWSRGGGRASAAGLWLASGFAALANHKMVILPAALALWELVRPGHADPRSRLSRSCLHPAVIGFAAGTGIFWLYGLAIDFEDFWSDHVRHHLVDRITHYNELGYGGYPSAPALWLEFWRHTGYLLLPFGAFALFAGLRGSGDGAGARPTTAPWLVWAAATAIAFSVIDWRMTKHLVPLILPLVLGPALWAGRGKIPRIAVCAAWVLLTGWNAWTIGTIARDFASFHVSPAW